MNNMSSLEAAAEAAAKVNAMLIAKGKLKPPPSAINKCKGSNVKSAGDLFTSEVEINDAPLSARNLLTRGHTQDEINKYSGAAVSTRGRYMTFEEKAKNTGERPLYLYVQASEKHAVDLGVHRIQEIIQQHMQQQQNEQPQTQHQPPQQMPQQQQTRRNSKFHKFVPRSANGVQQGNRPPPLMSIQTSMPSVEKVFVGLDHAGPAFDLRNKVVGTGGTNLLYIRNETGAIVTLRGKGSGYVEPSTGAESPEPMYLCIEHPKFEGLQSAKQLAQNLVETLQQEFAQWQQQQQQQQMNTLAMQNSVLHPSQFQAMGVGMGQPGIVTVHQPLQQQELLQSGIPGMVTTSVALPVVSNMPTILAGQIQQAPQLANLQQHQQPVQHQVQQPQQHQHQLGLPPHIQTGHPPPPHALMPTQQQHHQQQSQTIGIPQQHHLQIHPQQQPQQGMGGGIAFPPQMHQAILSPLQTMSQPQQQTNQHIPGQHQGPPPPGVMTQHQMASITQMAQQTVQGTLLVSPGQMVFTQAPVSSPQHQSPQPQHPQQHHQSHQPAPQQQLPPQAQLHHQQPLAQTPPPPPLPPTNQQPPSTLQQQQHMPAFQQMYIPQQLQQQGAGGMAVPPMHAAMMHPPPIGISPHPQPVPMPNLSNQPQQSPQMNNGMQHGFMGIPSNQTMQSAPNNSVHMGAYSYQQFSPAGNGPGGGMPGSGGGSLPAVSYPIYRQEQRPPPPSGNVSSDQPSNPGGQQQLMGGKTGAHKRRFTEDADHPDDGFQQGGMPVMNAMGQPPPPPPSHSPNHHQPPPRQGNGLQEMMVGSSGPSTLAPPSLQQQHGSSSSHQHQLQQHHPQQHHHHQQQQDRDKQLMPPPPPPLPSGEKRPAVQNEPDVKRHKGALSSVSGYGSDEEDQNNGDESQQRQQQRNQQQHGNSSSPSFSASGGNSNFMPPKPTFTHYSSKPQMYGHHQGAPPPPLPSQSATPSTQAQSPPNTSMPVTSTASNLTSTSPHNFQSLPCPPPQPPPPLQQHQMSAGSMYSSNPPPQLAASQQQVPTQSLPPPSYGNQGGQQHQQSVAFTGYQYNSSLPFWMVQQ